MLLNQSCLSGEKRENCQIQVQGIKIGESEIKNKKVLSKEIG